MFKSALTLLAVVVVLPYACTPVYRFGDARPFAGASLYNPYASTAGTAWKRANLHAHGRAWLGVTSARQSDGEVAAAYHARGYDVAAISDYQHIASPSDSSLAEYEHGFNVGKHHQIAIGARGVAWFDLPLWQGVNQKQYVIERVSETAALVALAHPTALQGYAYGDDDLQALSGYQLIEVVNGRFATEGSWDAALSAGRPVWAIGDDDTHDVTNSERFGVAWNMIAAASTAPADLIDALRRGRTYAVLSAGHTAERPPRLTSVAVRDGAMTLTCDTEAEIVFIGQNGNVRSTADRTTSASYTFAPDDTYIRTLVRTPAHTLFINPVIRYDGRSLPSPAAVVDGLSTWVQRLLVLAFVALLVASIVRRHLGRGGRDGASDSRPWRHVAAFVVLLAAAMAAPARAQEPAAPAPFDTTFDAATISALPSGDSVSTLLETANAETISDRVSTGGLGFGSAAHLSAFGSSVTQTRYRVGDIDVTDPAAGGTPLFLPELPFWDHVSATSGIGSADVNNAGLAIALAPRAPGDAWRSTAEGSSSFGDALTATPSSVPAVASLAGWNRGSVVASGPLVPQRVGIVLAGAVTREAETQRGFAPSLDSTIASAFAHVVVAASPRDELRFVGVVQRTTTPAATPDMFTAAEPTVSAAAVHLQATWARDERGARPWRAFAGYTERNRSPEAPVGTTATIERLVDGPPALVGSDTAARTERRFTIGGRARRRHGAHTLDASADLELARANADPGFAGVVGELVDGTPARLWRFASPSMSSSRRLTSIALAATDRFTLNDHATLDAWLRFEHLAASAAGAGQGIGWSTLLPHALFRSSLSQAHHVDWFVGGGISAYELPLDVLAWGDPAAPSLDVYRWSGGGPPAPVGPRLLNVGPGGTGRIDPNLRRPYSDDLTFGVEARPGSGVTVELAGLCRWEKNLFGVMNLSPNGPVYTTVNVADPGLDLPNPADDQILRVWNLALPATGYGFDNVLTNAPDATARRLGAKLTTAFTNDKLAIVFGATAYEAEGRASSRGYSSAENDQGLVGEDPLNPNAAIYDRGRLFGDRAFAGKLSAVYRFPADVTLGGIARYHDGQPFARLVIVPNLNQGPDVVRAFANGGSRFTFTATLDLRLQKTFAVDGRRVAAFVDGYNVTNRNDEVEERAVTGTAFRTPTAFQPPRTFRVGARVEF